MHDVIVYVAFGLSLLSNILHFIAPRTKTKVDDKAADVVDKAQEVLPSVGAVLPPHAEPADPAKRVRDHR